MEHACAGRLSGLEALSLLIPLRLDLERQLLADLAPPTILSPLQASSLNQSVLSMVGESVFEGKEGPLWVIDDQGDDIDFLTVEAQRKMCQRRWLCKHPVVQGGLLRRLISIRLRIPVRR